MPKKVAKKTSKAAAPKAAAKPVSSVAPVKSAKPAKSATASAQSSPKPVAIPTSVRVLFALDAPEAGQVSVCGEFNEWRAGVASLKRRGDGGWEATLELRPGRYQYKFVVDGNWIHDPNAAINVPNAHGSLNSVIEVRA